MEKPARTVRRCQARQRETRLNPFGTQRSRTSLRPSRRVNRSKLGCSGPQRAFLSWAWNPTAACPDSRRRRPPKAHHPGLVAPAVHQPTPGRGSATNMPASMGVAHRRPSGLAGHGICRFSGWGRHPRNIARSQSWQFSGTSLAEVVDALACAAGCLIDTLSHPWGVEHPPVQLPQGRSCC